MKHALMIAIVLMVASCNNPKFHEPVKSNGYVKLGSILTQQPVATDNGDTLYFYTLSGGQWWYSSENLARFFDNDTVKREAKVDTTILAYRNRVR